MNDYTTKSDFSGYATKNDVMCSDGRIIRTGAFAQCDGSVVPLCFQHDHSSPSSVIGKVMLENRDDGVYCYGYLNDTVAGKEAREIIRHGDMMALSIAANQIKQNGPDVVHGMIREVSLVFAGANPEARIDNVIAHSDDSDSSDAIVAVFPEDSEIIHGEYAEDPSDVFEPLSVYDALDITHGDNMDNEDNSENEESLSPDEYEAVFDSMSDKQKQLLYAFVGMAANDKEFAKSLQEDSEDSEDATQPDDQNAETAPAAPAAVEKAPVVPPDTKSIKTELDVTHPSDENKDQDEDKKDEEKPDTDDSDKEAEDKKKKLAIKHSSDLGDPMNIFENNQKNEETLSHADQEAFMQAAAKNPTGSFTRFALEHAQDYGIKNIGVFFPDAKPTEAEPDMYKRDTAWVQAVLSSVHTVPFARIKSQYVDMTEKEARAKGYTLDRDNNHRKFDEMIKAYKRVTTPTTVYKKQKLDRDDILDITDFDVVNFLRKEMRVMLDEEVARAYLIGDGREVTAEDHINTESIRPIVDDDDLYVIRSVGAKEETATTLIDRIRGAQVGYQGSGDLTAFVSPSLHAKFATLRDQMGRRLFDTDQALAFELGVSRIVEVPALENFKAKDGKAVDAIIVNLRDYTVGADKGGEVNSFDNFDIDYNQYKYLMETRQAGALTKPKSAIVIESDPKE